jgi:RNA ligase
MNYQFPLINNISDVLPAIAGRDEFVVAEKEGYTVINYNVMMADTFPDVEEDEEGWLSVAAVRRECRGIIFDSETGEILRRPFHKFFNVNERDETQDYVVDLSRPHAILEKLDGSMIAPFRVDRQTIWGTKMGVTDVAKPVEEFVKNHPVYADFALGLLTGECTPIFEWCSRKQRIVLDYKEDRLILTGIRENVSGEYWTHTEMCEYAEIFGIPVVRQFEPQTDMKAFLDYVRDLEDLEGFVVRFDDGHMLKLKCHWYLQIHKAKEAILQDRNIVELILEEHLDDVKAHLPAEDRDCLTQFENEINHDIGDRVYMIHNDLTWLKEEGIDRKTFALEHASNYDQFTRAIMFKNFDVKVDSTKLWADVCNTIRNNLTKTVKYEAIRDAWFPGVVYNV